MYLMENKPAEHKFISYKKYNNDKLNQFYNKIKTQHVSVKDM